MRTILTPDVLKTLSHDEFEDWRDSGEYRSEFGGFFPVQVRFTPSRGDFHLAVCSPGDVTPLWLMVFIMASGCPFSIVRTLQTFSTEIINHTLSLVARLDTDGYSSTSIISVLAMEGAS